jgi:hypothetical protein
MKNALISGAIIGVVSIVWLFVMHSLGIDLKASHSFTPSESIAGLIPLIGLYFGVRGYRENYLGGQMSFLEGLIEGFKILLVAGVIAVAGAIIYIDYVAAGTIADFSGEIFAALLLGLLFSLAVSLLLTNKHKTV